MARTIPDHRFHDLVEAATSVFIAQGYRRTQMGDVARAVGLAKGTLYLYVESKEALFDAVLRHADANESAALPENLPIPTPPPAATLAYFRKRLAEESALPALAAALGRRRVVDAAGELDDVIRELYRTLHRNRTAITLVDRCARDHPELAEIWFARGRGGAVDGLTQLIRDRIRRGHYRALVAPAVAARFVLETVTFWAVHRYWDPAPQPVDDADAEQTVLALLHSALVPE